MGGFFWTWVWTWFVGNSHFFGLFNSSGCYKRNSFKKFQCNLWQLQSISDHLHNANIDCKRHRVQSSVTGFLFKDSFDCENANFVKQKFMYKLFLRLYLQTIICRCLKVVFLKFSEIYFDEVARKYGLIVVSL